MSATNPPNLPDEPTAIAMLLSEDPRLELREELFPVRRIVLAIHFGNVGGTTIPIPTATARTFAADLVALADEVEAEGTGDQN